MNLRQSFFTAGVLDESMRHARIVKLNYEELHRVLRTLDVDNDHRSIETAARALQRRYELKVVCVMCVADGSMLIREHETDEHAGFAVSVVDTVGAGDAFTAALADGLLRQLPMQHINEAANRLGRWVASQRGARPKLDAEL